MKKISKNWTANFLSNVLGVIVGIALTFGITFLIQRQSEKKQIRELMVFLRQEIADNKATFERIQEDYLQTKEAYGIFLSDEWKLMPNDTLSKHIFYARQLTSYTLPNSAWNIFQNSNVIQNLDKKGLIIVISNLYKMIENQGCVWDDFLKRKSGVFDIYVDESIEKYSFVETAIKDKPTLAFMKDTYYYTTYENVFTAIIDLADYALHLIDQSGNYQYEFNNIDENFDMFREKKHKESETK